MLLGAAITGLWLLGLTPLEIEGYWNHSYVTTYKGFDIYYFSYPGVYGFDPSGENGAFNQETWIFTGSGYRNYIDSLDYEAKYIETYREYDIYKDWNGVIFYYYGQRDNDQTNSWDDIDKLMLYIDDVWVTNAPVGATYVNGEPVGLGQIVTAKDSPTITYQATENAEFIEKIVIQVNDQEQELPKVSVDTWEKQVELASGSYNITLSSDIGGRVTELASFTIIRPSKSYIGLGIGAGFFTLGVFMRRREEN